MLQNNNSALQITDFLLQIKAIKLQPNQPFTWASGIKAPIYCDNRKILSYPKIRTYIRQEITKILSDNFGKPDVIAGVATGGIALGVLVAQELGVPFVYVRPASKSHGLENKIEGVIEEGQSVLVIEDLVSTGASSLNAVETIRNAGCTVKGMVAIFTYDLEEAKEKFKIAKCQLVTLTNYDVLIQKAADISYISIGDIKSLKEWRKDPKSWEPSN
jgi:orotate phosphoribosyltransferase